MRNRKRLVALIGSVAIAASAGMAVIGSGVANAAACAPPTITTDTGAGSLREVLETLPGGCDLVELTAGATYDLTLTGVDPLGGDIDIAGPVTIVGNGATIRQTVDNRVLDTNFDLTLRNVTITGGNTSSSGAGLDFDGTVLRIENSTFAGNCTDDGGGGGVDIDGPQKGAVTATIIGSTFSGNTANDGAAINVGTGSDSTSFVMVNSTVTGNTSDQDGAIDIDDGVDAKIVYSTIVANAHVANVSCRILSGATAEPDEAEAAEAAAEEQEALDEEGVDALVDGESASISVSETSGEGTPSTLAVFGTVVAQPTGGPNCSNDIEGDPKLALTASSGYNFSDDATCGFTNTAAGDRQSAGAPGLGALASNGGPTQTLLPSATSPLLDFIPLASCGGGNALAGFAVTKDQRGVTRPQGPGCEIGSVEIEVKVEVAAPITIVPRFTG